MMYVNQEKPPRQNRGGQKNSILSALALQRIPALPVFGFAGSDVQPHLPSQNARDKSSNRVSLPAGGFHQIRPSGSAGSLQQVEKLGGFAALAGTGGLFYRLSRLGGFVGLLCRSSLFARLALRRCHVGRTCGDTRPFGRNRLPGRGGAFAIGGIFCNIVHFDFSFGGDYRDDHINRSGFLGLQADSDKIATADGPKC